MDSNNACLRAMSASVSLVPMNGVANSEDASADGSSADMRFLSVCTHDARCKVRYGPDVRYRSPLM